MATTLRASGQTGFRSRGSRYFSSRKRFAGFLPALGLVFSLGYTGACAPGTPAKTPKMVAAKTVAEYNSAYLTTMVATVHAAMDKNNANHDADRRKIIEAIYDCRRRGHDPKPFLLGLEIHGTETATAEKPWGLEQRGFLLNVVDEAVGPRLYKELATVWIKKGRQKFLLEAAASAGFSLEALQETALRWNVDAEGVGFSPPINVPLNLLHTLEKEMEGNPSYGYNIWNRHHREMFGFWYHGLEIAHGNVTLEADVYIGEVCIPPLKKESVQGNEADAYRMAIARQAAEQLTELFRFSDVRVFKAAGAMVEAQEIILGAASRKEIDEGLHALVNSLMKGKKGLVSMHCRNVREIHVWADGKFIDRIQLDALAHFYAESIPALTAAHGGRLPAEEPAGNIWARHALAKEYGGTLEAEAQRELRYVRLLGSVSRHPNKGDIFTVHVVPVYGAMITLQPATPLFILRYIPSDTKAPVQLRRGVTTE